MTPRAEKLLQLLKEMPSDHGILYGLGMESMSEHAYEDAVRWLDQACDADANHAYTWFHLARALHEAGQTERIAAALDHGDKAARTTGDTKAASELAALRESLLP